MLARDIKQTNINKQSNFNTGNVFPTTHTQFDLCSVVVKNITFVTYVINLFMRPIPEGGAHQVEHLVLLQE